MSFLSPDVIADIETGLGTGEEQRVWQAAVRLGDFVEVAPNEVWSLVTKWGDSDNDEVRMALATCVLEHLLEHHFDRYFPLVEELALTNSRFADTFSSCWQFGQSEAPENAARMASLNDRIRKRHGAA